MVTDAVQLQKLSIYSGGREFDVVLTQIKTGETIPGDVKESCEFSNNERKFEEMKKMGGFLDFPKYSTCFIQYWDFVLEHNKEKFKEFRKLLLGNRELLDLEKRYLVEIEPEDDDDSISLIAYELFKNQLKNKN